jgi:hypothetical protein
VLEYWSKVFPLGIPPSDSTCQGLNCPKLASRSISHLAMPRYCAISIILLRPLVEFQKTSRKHCSWRPWSYASLNSYVLKQHTMAYNIFSWISHHSYIP